MIGVLSTLRLLTSPSLACKSSVFLFLLCFLNLCFLFSLSFFSCYFSLPSSLTNHFYSLSPLIHSSFSSSSTISSSSSFISLVPRSSFSSTPTCMLFYCISPFHSLLPLSLSPDNYKDSQTNK